jgi:hypothetical protein
VSLVATGNHSCHRCPTATEGSELCPDVGYESCQNHGLCKRIRSRIYLDDDLQTRNLQAEEQAQALDPNGRRYLLAFSGHIEDSSETTSEEATWALHSQSKTVCLQTVISQCPNELILWSDVQRHKLSYWVEDDQIVRPSRTLDLPIAFLTLQDPLVLRPSWPKRLPEITLSPRIEIRPIRRSTISLYESQRLFGACGGRWLDTQSEQRW